MPLPIRRLRFWFAVTAIALTVVVAGVYFYARLRVANALKQVPGKIGVEIQQTAQGFTMSKSEQGRTLFTVRADKAIQFKEGGHAQLHNVSITLYGHDSSRYDQIYGSEFDYDPKSGDVTAKGDVQIDLESNPQGLSHPDQTPPKELRNPIHLKTSGLVFNQKTGNASTKEKVEFQTPQATGSATGVSYVAKDSTLIMHSQVNVVFGGPRPAAITAERGTITKDPHVIVLDHPRLQSGTQDGSADGATLFLRQDNTAERVLATGNVNVESKGTRPVHATSQQLELFLSEKNNLLHTAIFSGDVRMEQAGPQPLQGNSERAVLNFAGKNQLMTVHADGDVHLGQHQQNSSQGGGQDVELKSPVVDFVLAGGRRLKSAETSGPPQIIIRPTAPGTAGQQTVITAGKFTAQFDKLGRVSLVHGAPDTHVANSNPGQPDRVSTSNTIDATFRPGTGIDAIVQQGNVTYHDAERKAWGSVARYTPADQILLLTGSPRLVDGGMTTTAISLRMNRFTGDAFAEGDVRTTYSDLKPQPGGGLLASSSPIHVTSHSLTAHRVPAVAVYGGEARLWQDANLITAPTIEFDRDRRFITAHSSPAQNVSTFLVQTDKDGAISPVKITSALLTYSDNEHKARFDGDVVAKGTDFTLTSAQTDIFILQPKDQKAASQSLATPARIDRIVARGHVLVSQPTRRATGEQLVYTAADDKFVMTGGSPSIFDAEHGKITGVSLTFYKRDDRVLVDGNSTSPTITKARVAR